MNKNDKVFVDAYLKLIKESVGASIWDILNYDDESGEFEVELERTTDNKTDFGTYTATFRGKVTKDIDQDKYFMTWEVEDNNTYTGSSLDLRLWGQTQGEDEAYNGVEMERLLKDYYNKFEEEFKKLNVVDFVN